MRNLHACWNYSVDSRTIVLAFTGVALTDAVIFFCFAGNCGTTIRYATVDRIVGLP
jgi:hypothetical protein